MDGRFNLHQRNPVGQRCRQKEQSVAPGDHALGRSRGGQGRQHDALRHYCTRYGMRLIIPPRHMHRRPKPGLSHQFDRPKYHQRNVVERLFGWLQKKRRFNTRYDKLASRFKAMVTLACTESDA